MEFLFLTPNERASEETSAEIEHRLRDAIALNAEWIDLNQESLISFVAGISKTVHQLCAYVRLHLLWDC